MQTNDMPICSTCSCQVTGLGRITIHIERKWLTSPTPCPECLDRWRMKLESLGRSTAERRERAVMDAILRR